MGNRQSRMLGLRDGKHVRWGPAFCLGGASGHRDRARDQGRKSKGKMMHQWGESWGWLRWLEALGQVLNRNYRRRETPNICVGVLLNLWLNTKYWMHRARLQNANSTLMRGKNFWKTRSGTPQGHTGPGVPTTEGRETLLNTKGIQ